MEKSHLQGEDPEKAVTVTLNLSRAFTPNQRYSRRSRWAEREENSSFLTHTHWPVTTNSKSPATGLMEMTLLS